MIPAWNSLAVLPPIWPGQAGNSPERSPYIASLSELIRRFAISPQRIEILRGLLRYRAALNRAGVTAGFQWLNGSFVEDKETLLGTAPSDIDVVTFFHLPDGISELEFAAAHRQLFSPEQTKAEFHVDAYGEVLGRPITPLAVRKISYWYSMWSHTRSSFVWKGFIQVDISRGEDDLAAVLLDQIEHEHPIGRSCT